MWTRDKDEFGKHRFTVYDDASQIYAQQGGFDCYQQCERMAEIQQRNCLFGYPKPVEPAPQSLDDISDAELLALLAD